MSVPPSEERSWFKTLVYPRPLGGRVLLCHGPVSPMVICFCCLLNPNARPCLVCHAHRNHPKIGSEGTWV